MLRRLLVLLVFAAVAGRAGAQTVPGFHVDVYANVLDPMRFDFAPTGELYCGRDVFGSGGLNGDPARIWRIGAGGSPVDPFGAMIIDPDAVAFDATGTFTGFPGAVLVGGYRGTPVAGLLTVIQANETTTPLHAVTPGFANPSEMRVDAPRSRLLFVDPNAGSAGIWQMTSTAYPTLLFSLPQQPSFFAIDGSGDIYTSSNDGVVRVHDAAGALVDASFATLTGLHALEVGWGGAFGTDLYALSRTGGELRRVDASGNSVVIGTGFGAIEGFRFGPDGALYVAEFNNDRILRISPHLADLQVTATTGPDPAIRGDDVYTQFLVLNAGPDPADDAELLVLLPDPAQASLVAITSPGGTCAVEGNHRRCPLGTIAPAVTATVTLQVHTLLAGTLTSSATATSSTTDPDPANQTVYIETLVFEPQIDAGEPDAEAPPDAGTPDAETLDTSTTDTGTADTGTTDAGATPADAAPAPDAAGADAAAPPRDSGAPDAGTTDTDGDGCGCSTVPAVQPSAPAWLALAWLFLRRRRRLTREARAASGTPAGPSPARG